MGKLRALICRTADSDPGSSDTEIPKKSPGMLEIPSTEEGPEILRMGSFPVEHIMGFFGVEEDTTSPDKIWCANKIEMPDFLRNTIDALTFMRVKTPYPDSLWTVQGPLFDTTIKVLLTSGIALESGMTVVPRKEFYKRELPIVLRPKVGLMVDVQYLGKPRRLKIRAPYTIWHGDEKDAGISIVIFQTELRRHYSVAEAPCLAYMGAIHRARKAIHQDACIYGIATNGKGWIFIRIDNESKVSFGYNSTLYGAYVNLRIMVRHAMHLASQRVAASIPEQLPSSIRFYDPYKKLPPEFDIDADTEFE